MTEHLLGKKKLYMQKVAATNTLGKKNLFESFRTKNKTHEHHGYIWHHMD